MKEYDLLGEWETEQTITWSDFTVGNSGFSGTWNERQLASDFMCVFHLVRSASGSHSVPLTALRPFPLPQEGPFERTIRNLQSILDNINTVQAECVWCAILMCHLQ